MFGDALLFGVLGEHNEVFIGDHHHLFTRIDESQILFCYFFNIFLGGVVLKVGESLVIFGFKLGVADFEFLDVFFNLIVFVNGHGEVVEHVSNHKKTDDKDESHQVKLVVVAFLEHFR